jgi:multiple sugar transport system permease protein
LLRTTSEFVGASNLIKVLSNKRFWNAFVVDILFTAGAVGLGALVGLWASLILHQRLPFRNIARGFVIFPYVIPTIVAVLVWRYMFNDLYGIINYMLSFIGVDAAGWLSTPRTALSATILVATWKYFPFYVIALLARLQIIPIELYEAARIDGASTFQCFRYITWPAILPIFLLTIILRIIWTFNKFDIIFLLTGGGPGDSTTTLPILIYNKAFIEFDLGGAAAMAIFMFVFLGLMGMIYVFTSERLEDVYA